MAKNEQSQKGEQPQKNEQPQLNPDQVVLNKIQQKRLAALSGISAKEIGGKNIAQLTEALKWRIDPRIFFFQKVCGKVVKKDPVTGVEYPVPFATVYVEDTDCNLIIYHPIGHPWSWHFPYFCTREIIAQTKTDACGNFCVWIPRFDIDWILRWRKHRICFPIIFRRPIIKDILFRTPSIPIPPPEPEPFERFARSAATIPDAIGGNQVEILRNEMHRLKNSASLGTVDQENESSLNRRVFDSELPPPLPADFQKALAGQDVVASKGASAVDAVRAEVAAKLGLEPGTKELQDFNYNRFIGPFYRCVDFYVPEWQRVIEVPDITFRVTQDTNGDGVEETIYSEGYFDVRWNDTNIPDVTLVASDIAKASRVCNAPEVPCSNVPDIVLAGFMPLHNAGYFNDNTGYALRPNRPRPSGSPGGPFSFPAATPFCGVVQLYGCVAIQNAKYYRVHHSIDGGTNWSVLTGLSWNNYLGSLPVPITSDTNGWYPVDPIHPITLNPIPRSNLAFEHFLLDWPTPENETNLLRLELGDNSKNHISNSADVAIVTDNTLPNITPTMLAWKYVGEPDGALRSLIGGPCPMIQRGAIPQDIELIFRVSVSAVHLRDAGLGTSGCGGGSFIDIADPANNPAHWHMNQFDNSEVLYQRYRLSAGAKPGCYSFACTANSRAMNPSGADGGNQIPPDWFYEPVYKYSHYTINVAVVNENL